MSDTTFSMAGGVRIVITGEGEQFSTVVNNAKRSIEKLTGAAKTANSHMVTGTQAASASIRVLEGNINNNVRAAERFLANTLQLGPALQAAFPVVGAIAFGAVIARLGKEVYDFIEQNEQAARRSAEAWRSVDSPIRATNDELRVVNDRLENALAKLEGHPQNGLKLAIDEAIASADKLGDKLDADVKKIADTLKTQQPPWYQRMIGTRGTGDITDRAQSLEMQLGTQDIAGHERLAKLRSGGGTGSQVEALSRQLDEAQRALIEKELAWAKGQLDQANATQNNVGRQNLMGRLDQTARIQALSHYVTDLARMSDFVGLTEDNQSLTTRNDAANQRLEAARAAHEAGQRQLQGWRQELQAEKAQHVMNLDAEAEFWQKKADSVKKGTDLYNATLMEANKARAQSQQKMVQDFVSQAIQDQERGQTEGDRITQEVTAEFFKQQQQDEEAERKRQQEWTQYFERDMQMRRAQEAVEEEQIRQAVESGGMSRLQGALQLQALHQQGFAQWQGDAAQFSAQFPNAQLPGAAQSIREFGVQGQRDAAAVESATAMGALRDSAYRLSGYFLDMPAQIGEAFQRTLSDLNDKLVQAMSGQRGVNFSEVGVGMAQSVERMGLQFLEGTAIKAVLGFDPTAKLGTKGNPMYVRNADGGSSSTGGLGGIFSSILGMFGGGAGAAAGGAGAGVGDVLGGIGTALLGFATGGAVPAGMPAIVGERGPELFMPATSGRIIPNDRLDSMGGTSIHVDARGSTDPAATEMAVHRAMRGYMAMVPNVAVSAVRNYNSRVPSNMRVGR